MYKKSLILIVSCIILFVKVPTASALSITEACSIDNDLCDRKQNLYCQPNPQANAAKTHYCQEALTITDKCDPVRDACDKTKGLSCQPNPQANAAKTHYCQEDSFGSIFGKIKAPDALKGLIAKDPTGAGGLSIFFSNLITLFYIMATIVLIFMIVWGAFDWITSEGDKEKLAGARSKIINALIGILLFAAAFGIIRILGQFTGFQFFVGQ